MSSAIANHHNALAIFSDESNHKPQLKNLLAILKMAEHICASYRVLTKMYRKGLYALSSRESLNY